MKEIDKMKAGLEYCYDDPEIDAIKESAIQWTRAFNSIDNMNFEAQKKCLKEHLGSMGDNVWIAKTFNCDNGKNIHIGNNFTGNYNLTILDVGEVHIGNHVMIGPNTLISTVNHPMSPKGRRKYLASTKPVIIGNDVWIGGNVTIVPGVTIGNNVVVAAVLLLQKIFPIMCLSVVYPLASFVKLKMILMKNNKKELTTVPFFLHPYFLKAKPSLKASPTRPPTL